MASSEEKAVGLKDAYVAGLLDSAGPEGAAEAGAGAMQELAGKLGIEQGQQASIEFDLDKGIQYNVNDRSPEVRYKKNGRILSGEVRGESGQRAAMPVKGLFGNNWDIGGGGESAEERKHMSDGQIRYLENNFNSGYDSRGGGTRLTPHRGGTNYLSGRPLPNMKYAW